MSAMNIDQITAACIAAYHADKQPLMIWGPPGVGKSSGVKEAARLLGEQFYPAAEVKKLPKKDQADAKFGFIDLRLSIRLPEDLTGVMWPDAATGTVKYFKPGFLPTSGRGILFLDELVQAVPMMQAAASQLVLDRQIGEYKLPDGWHVLAAGNRLSDKAAVNAMPTNMKNRFVHLYADVDVDAWVKWALRSKIDLRVIAFIKFRRALLHNFDPQNKGEAFATPRSWEFTSGMISKGNTDRALLAHMIRGAVGEGPGAEFDGFLRVADKIVSPETIILNPHKADIPTEPATLYAVMTMLAAKATKDNLGSIAIYFNRITDTGHPDYAIAAMKEITVKDESLTKTRAFIEWAAKHNHILN